MDSSSSFSHFNAPFVSSSFNLLDNSGSYVIVNNGSKKRKVDCLGYLPGEVMELRLQSAVEMDLSNCVSDIKKDSRLLDKLIVNLNFTIPPSHFDIPRKNKKFNMYIHQDLRTVLIVIQVRDGSHECVKYGTGFIKEQNLPISLKFLQSLSHKASFLLCPKDFDSELAIEIWLTPSCIHSVSLDEQPLVSPNHAVINVMGSLFNYDTHEFLQCSKETPVFHMKKVFETVRQYHDKLNFTKEYQQPYGLIPQLRNYQKRCVQWMLEREKSNLRPSQPKDHPLWLFNEKLNLLYNHYGGYFLDPNSNAINLNVSCQTFGGILADEMGLGKTVELLALILSNFRVTKELSSSLPDMKNKHCKSAFQCCCGVVSDLKFGDKTLLTCVRCKSTQHQDCVNFNFDLWGKYPYYCPQCWADQDLVESLESGATLIVVPQSLVKQWEDEVTKHSKKKVLNVLTYEGISAKYIYPYDLYDCDVVIVSYEVLRNELKFVNPCREERFRNPKRFRPFPSPLLAINWWRICLDEAQMVESVLSQAAKMVNKLYSVNRWAITGTPIQKSINDLYGLALFVGETPFNSRLWWDRLIAEPYFLGKQEPLISLLKKLCWRNTKKDVATELGLTAQNEHIICLNFTPIEAHFYMREKENCEESFLKMLRNFDNLDERLKSMDTRSCQRIMAPLLTLRQACCHPQIVGNAFINWSKKTMTMDEVLDLMIKKTTIECEESHRKVISSINGQAGISIIKENYAEAVELYRSVLQSIELYKEKFRTDKLQLYHTLYNLADILNVIRQKTHPNQRDGSSEDLSIVQKIGRTIREENLNFEAEALKKEYLNAGLRQISESKKQLEVIWDQTSSKINLLSHDWWEKAIKKIVSRSSPESFLTKIYDGLEGHALEIVVEQGKIYSQIKKQRFSVPGLQYIITNLLDELGETRERLGQEVLYLQSMPSSEDFNAAVDCHLRIPKTETPNDLDIPKCKYCSIHETFNFYESRLYYFTNEEKLQNVFNIGAAILEKQRTGNWSDSEIEQTLKIIINLAKRISTIDQNIIKAGTDCLELLSLMKKEFRHLRSVWVNIFDFISRMDELNMAAYRLRKRFPDEPKPDEGFTYILEEHQINDTFYSLKYDEKVAQVDLKKNLARLNYLRNLQDGNVHTKGEPNPDPCPICTVQLGEKWAAFPCGHIICTECLILNVANLKEQSNRSAVKCAICREVATLDEIVHVNLKPTQTFEESIAVSGSWSTKIEELIRVLKKIQMDERGAKCLVFSSWMNFLIVLSEALLTNNIKFILAQTKKKLIGKLKEFKTNPEVNILLMPFNFGSKGLNLVEANYVILVEPLLEPAQEYQAIGRIHRIGQEKPIHVYKLLVSDTVEEKIHAMFSYQSEGFMDFFDLKEEAQTIRDIKDIFFSKS